MSLEAVQLLPVAALKAFCDKFGLKRGGVAEMRDRVEKVVAGMNEQIASQSVLQPPPLPLPPPPPPCSAQEVPVVTLKPPPPPPPPLSIQPSQSQPLLEPALSIETSQSCLDVGLLSEDLLRSTCRSFGLKQGSKAFMRERLREITAAVDQQTQRGDSAVTIPFSEVSAGSEGEGGEEEDEGTQQPLLSQQLLPLSSQGPIALGQGVPLSQQGLTVQEIRSARAEERRASTTDLLAQMCRTVRTAEDFGVPYPGGKGIYSQVC